MLIGIILALILFGTVFYFARKKSEPYRTDYKPQRPEYMKESEEVFISELNKYRSRIGVQELKPDALCYKVANEHCMDIVETGTPSHDGFPERVYELTLNNAKKVGEVVGHGYKGPKGHFKGYMGSPDHKDILSNPEFTHVGCAILGYTNVTILAKYEK